MPEVIVSIVLCLASAASVYFRKLTIAGGITGAGLAWLLYKGAGVTGLIMLAAFFIAGTTATAVGARKKEQLGLAEENKGQRTAGQVLANGGVAALCGLLAWIFPSQSTMWQMAASAALASASADTLSSELGNLWGKRFYNILTFKKDTRGLNGVVSLEGTLWGIAGSAMIAVIYSVGYGYTGHALWIIVAGTVGNLTDSILGASFERKGRLSNDWVNGLNTLVATGCGLLLYSV